jgi:hypothetical protein
MKLLDRIKQTPLETKILIIVVIVAVVFYSCVIEP